MIRRFINRRSAGFALLFFVVLSTSCNRGVGCPNKFSVEDLLGELVQFVALIF